MGPATVKQQLISQSPSLMTPGSVESGWKIKKMPYQYLPDLHGAHGRLVLLVHPLLPYLPVGRDGELGRAVLACQKHLCPPLSPEGSTMAFHPPLAQIQLYAII